MQIASFSVRSGKAFQNNARIVIASDGKMVSEIRASLAHQPEMRARMKCGRGVSARIQKAIHQGSAAAQRRCIRQYSAGEKPPRYSACVYRRRKHHQCWQE